MTTYLGSKANNNKSLIIFGFGAWLIQPVLKMLFPMLLDKMLMCFW